jgi:DNA-binding transcriptional regulator/RsmH inhibitor MraZ
LVNYAGLGPKAVFLGLGDRVEIWDQVRWEKREKYVSEHAGEFIEKLADDKK